MSVEDVDLARIAVPVLFVHDANDAYGSSPPAAIKRLAGVAAQVSRHRRFGRRENYRLDPRARALSARIASRNFAPDRSRIQTND
jgi:hypothetical protein